MRSIRISALLILLLGLAPGAETGALTIGVIPMADWDLDSMPPAEIPPIEDVVTGCLDALFDAGLIVTEFSISAPVGGELRASAEELAAARKGGIDLLIAIYVVWAPQKAGSSLRLPIHTEYRMISVPEGIYIKEGKLFAPAALPGERPIQSIRATGRAVATACFDTLLARSTGGTR
jgi:hypothetical protein